MQGMRYQDILSETGWILHEEGRRLWPEIRCTERHIQSVWFDPRLRPGSIWTQNDERVEVLCPGRWNLEAGPDFQDAVLRIGDGAAMLHGDVEVHIYPADWDRHAHADDPRYSGVVLHVCLYPGTATTLPSSIRQVVLAPALRRRPDFRLDDIDLSAYPHAMIPREPRPCAAVLGDAPTRISALLGMAGTYRLERRTHEFSRELKRGKNPYQLFYEEIMAGLGFKKNSVLFRRLAHHLPLTRLNQHDDPEIRYAALLGTAGLLPSPDQCRTPDATVFARRLWDHFWRMPHRARTDDDWAWQTSGCRPVNHPRRRLAAAVTLFTPSHGLLDALKAIPVNTPTEWFAAAFSVFSNDCGLPYWRERMAFDKPPDKTAPGLLGRDRIASLLINIAVPMLRADPGLPLSWLRSLPPETISAPIREMSFRLLGHDRIQRVWLRNGLFQQGLIQMYQDFCLSARTGCGDCPLPDRLANLFREPSNLIQVPQPVPKAVRRCHRR